MSAQEAGRPGEIRIDKEGCWFFNGAPIINEKILALFNSSIEPDGSGGYRLHIDEETSPITVEDTPYVVTHVRREPGAGGEFTIRLSDGTRERLCLESLYLSGSNVPYCTVKDGLFPARFLRAPYYALAEYIEQDGDRFFLPAGGGRFYLEIK